MQRDVDAGEELCGEYVPVYYARAARREALSKYRFHCACEACAVSDAAAARSDADRERFGSLYRSLYATPPTDRGALAKVGAMLDVVAREFGDSPAMARRVLQDAVIIANAQGRATEATDFMRRLYDASVLSEGADTAASRRFAAFRADARRFRPSD